MTHTHPTTCWSLQADRKILAANYNKEYLPIEGLDTFRKATVQLLLGADHPSIKENKAAVVQVGVGVLWDIIEHTQGEGEVQGDVAAAGKGRDVHACNAEGAPSL